MINLKNFNVFTGTHSTGKTTVLEELKKITTGTNYCYSVTRFAKEKGISLNTDVSDSGQNDILDIYEDYEKTIKENSIMDRCLIDTLAYCEYFESKNIITPSTVKRVQEMLEKRIKSYTNIFYFPIEFKNVQDGTRIDDDEFREQVDVNIKDILKRYKIKYTIVTGNVKQRVQNILSTLYIVKSTRDEMISNLSSDFSKEAFRFNDEIKNWDNVFVYKENNRILGALYYRYYNKDIIQLVNVYSDKPGVGSILFSHLLTFDYKYMYFYMADNATKFYKKFNIVPITDGDLKFTFIDRNNKTTNPSEYSDFISEKIKKLTKFNYNKNKGMK